MWSAGMRRSIIYLDCEVLTLPREWPQSCIDDSHSCLTSSWKGESSRLWCSLCLCKTHLRRYRSLRSIDHGVGWDRIELSDTAYCFLPLKAEKHEIYLLPRIFSHTMCLHCHHWPVIVATRSSGLLPPSDDESWNSLSMSPSTGVYLVHLVIISRRPSSHQRRKRPLAALAAIKISWRRTCMQIFTFETFKEQNDLSAVRNDQMHTWNKGGKNLFHKIYLAKVMA